MHSRTATTQNPRSESQIPGPGMSCKSCPPPARTPETRLVPCCPTSLSGQDQQHRDAGRCQRVIAKAPHAYTNTQPHAKSHVLYDYSVDLAAFSWTTVGYAASFQTHAYTAQPHMVHTQMHVCSQTRERAGTRTQTHACVCKHADGQKGESQEGCHRQGGTGSCHLRLGHLVNSQPIPCPLTM